MMILLYKMDNVLQFNISGLTLVYDGPEIPEDELQRNIQRIKQWLRSRNWNLDKYNKIICWRLEPIDSKTLNLQYVEDDIIPQSVLNSALSRLIKLLNICILFNFHTCSNMTYSDNSHGY